MKSKNLLAIGMIGLGGALWLSSTLNVNAEDKYKPWAGGGNGYHPSFSKEVTMQCPGALGLFRYTDYPSNYDKLLAWESVRNPMGHWGDHCWGAESNDKGRCHITGIRTSRTIDKWNYYCEPNSDCWEDDTTPGSAHYKWGSIGGNDMAYFAEAPGSRSGSFEVQCTVKGTEHAYALLETKDASKMPKGQVEGKNLVNKPVIEYQKCNNQHHIPAYTLVEKEENKTGASGTEGTEEAADPWHSNLNYCAICGVSMYTWPGRCPLIENVTLGFDMDNSVSRVFGGVSDSVVCREDSDRVQVDYGSTATITWTLENKKDSTMINGYRWYCDGQLMTDAGTHADITEGADGSVFPLELKNISESGRSYQLEIHVDEKGEGELVTDEGAGEWILTAPIYVDVAVMLKVHDAVDYSGITVKDANGNVVDTTVRSYAKDLVQGDVLDGDWSLGALTYKGKMQDEDTMNGGNEGTFLVTSKDYGPYADKVLNPTITDTEFLKKWTINNTVSNTPKGTDANEPYAGSGGVTDVGRYHLGYRLVKETGAQVIYPENYFTDPSVAESKKWYNNNYSWDRSKWQTGVGQSTFYTASDGPMIRWFEPIQFTVNFTNDGATSKNNAPGTPPGPGSPQDPSVEGGQELPRDVNLENPNNANIVDDPYNPGMGVDDPYDPDEGAGNEATLENLDAYKVPGTKSDSTDLQITFDRFTKLPANTLVRRYKVRYHDDEPWTEPVYTQKTNGTYHYEWLAYQFLGWHQGAKVGSYPYFELTKTEQLAGTYQTEGTGTPAKNGKQYTTVTDPTGKILFRHEVNGADTKNGLTGLHWIADGAWIGNLTLTQASEVQLHDVWRARTVTLPGMTKSGSDYKFLDWSTKQFDTRINNHAITDNIDYVGAEVKAGAEYKPYRDTDFYAHWYKDIKLTFDLNGGRYNGSTSPIQSSITVYDAYGTVWFNTDGTLTGARGGERDAQVGGINAYGTFDINGINSMYTKVVGDTVYRFLGWSWDKDATKPLDKYCVYNPARNTQIKVEEWAQDCNDILNAGEWNGHTGPNLNPSNLNVFTHNASYTLYAVWEPVLTVNMELYRTLGDLSYSDPATYQATKITNVTAASRTLHKAGEAGENNYSHVGCGKVHNVVLRTIVRPGEQGTYRVVVNGAIPETVTTIEFSHNITDIYNNGDATSTWYDELNPPVSDSEGSYAIHGTVHPEHQLDSVVGIGVSNDSTEDTTLKHGLNRVYSGNVRNILNKFYTPVYFGTDKSYATSKGNAEGTGESGSTLYYMWATVSQPSTYYKWVYGTQEESLCICGQIDVITYAPPTPGTPPDPSDPVPSLPGGHTQGSEQTTLDELRSRLRIRILNN